MVALFQPAEEAGDGARGMVDDGLAELIPAPAVALAQHVMPLPAGRVGTRSGPALSAADSMRITVYGRGAHGSMPQAAVDPVVLAAMIVVRLQTVVSREVAPGETAVLTVGSIQAGTKSNVIPDRAVLQLNVRTYSDATRTAVLDAIRRIVRAECAASDCPKEPEFELFDRFPLTDNDAAVTDRVESAFAAFFGERAAPVGQQSASEDFSDIPTALGVPVHLLVHRRHRPGHATRRRRGPAGSPRTSRSTTPPRSPRSSSPPSTPARRRWSSPRWPGSRRSRAA